jgi:DME family drug/metabolite transporter
VRTDRDARAKASTGLPYVMLSAVTWGTVGVTTRALYGMSAATPLSVAFFRLALGVPVLFLAGWVRLRGRMFVVARRDLALMAAAGAMTALYQVCFFASIKHVGVATASLIAICGAPVLVSVISAVLASEWPSGKVLAALSCALAGTAMLVGVLPSKNMQGSVAVGSALAIGAAFVYSVVVWCSRSLADRCHPLQIVAIGFSVGAGLLLSVALPTGLVVSYSRAGWAMLAYLGLVPTAFAYALYLEGMRTVSATVASIATLLEPLTSTLLAWLIFGERLSSLGWLGTALLGVAMMVLLREDARG